MEVFNVLHYLQFSVDNNLLERVIKRATGVGSRRKIHQKRAAPRKTFFGYFKQGETFRSLLVARYFWLVARYYLLVARYFSSDCSWQSNLFFIYRQYSKKQKYKNKINLDQIAQAKSALHEYDTSMYVF